MKNIYEVNYMNDNDIDERIKNICLQAENNYILNHTTNTPIIEYNKENKQNISLNLNISSQLDKTITNSNDINNNNIYEINQNEIYNINNIKYKEDKEIINPKRKIINNKVINLRKNKTYNTNNINNNLDTDMINSINNKIKYRSNNIISPNTFINSYHNTKEESPLIISQSEIKKNNNTFLSSKPSFCFECDLYNLINDKNIYNKDLNIKAKENKEINKIILTGKILLQKNKLKKAYDLLHSYIINSNIKNPDLFYLYGETCRKLKNMEDAEKYLLSCMNFKNCSPYVYLSLAELYKEIGQIKFSKQFYKKCLLYFNKGNIYYNLGIIYMKLNKPLKALNFITEAIKLDKDFPLYYKFRSDIYKILGHKDLSEKDNFQHNILVNK